MFGTGKIDLVLDAEVTAEFLKAFASALFANNALKGKSVFGNKFSQKIASSKVTLIDDGTLDRGVMTRPVDGEGIPRKKTTLIDRGYLTNFLHNFHTALQMNVEATGNSRRSYYNEAPAIGPTNLYLVPGRITKARLLEDVDSGIYINYALGLHTIDTSSGEFSLGASGIAIEHGQLTYPVEGIAIAGNIADLLNSVAEIADDLRFFPDGFGGCAVLVKDISVSGS